MNYDTMTIGKWPARMPANKIQVSSSAYRVLFTKGDELLTAPQYRNTFDLSLEKAITGANVSDEAMARAFAVSATAYACTEYCANIIGNIPLQVEDGSGNELDDSPLSYFVKNSGVTLTDIVRGLLLWGRVYLRMRYNASGWPTGLEWLNPLRVREVKAGDNRVLGYDVELPSRRRERVDVKEIIYLQMFDTDPFGQGISKFEAAWRVVMVEQSIATYAAAFFVNSAQPDGFLSFDSPLSDTQLEEARNEWQKNFKGLQHAHRTAVMPGGAKWTPMQAVPKDLAMVELKDSQREDICAVFGVDPVLVGLKGTADPLSANSTYNTAEIAFVRRVALPLLQTLILPALNKQWASKCFDRPDYVITIDHSDIEVLSESYLAKADTSSALSDRGLLDYNESRELIGFDERYDYYKRNTVEALTNWQAGTITLGMYHKLVGTPGINPNDPNLNVININGTLLPYVQLAQVAIKNVEKLAAPPPQPFGFGGNQPPPQLPSGDNGNPPPDNKPPTPPTLPSGDVKPQEPPTGNLPPARSGLPLTIAVSFADNQFIRYARRSLSDALTAQGVKVDEWTPDNAWRCELATANEWTPNAVSGFLRNADYTDTRKLDLRANGYVYHEGAIYLTLEGDLSGFQKALAIDANTSAIIVKTDVFTGVRMATVSTKPETFPAADWPLVATNITLYVGTAEYHQWNLRGVSNAQAKELAAWRKAIGNKGASYQFKTEALTGHAVARFIADALTVGAGDDNVSEWVASVFDHADKWLKADSIRAYADTRANFYSEVLGFITDAQANDINRQNFAGRMRAALRRYGLVAFRDGMNDANYNPESMSAEELAAFRSWQSDQSSYVTNFGAEIFKQGITELEITARASMWTNKSLDTIYWQGVAFGAPNKLYRWVLGDTEHCHTCLSLEGKARTMKDWQATIMPRSSQLDCGGYNCGCSLVAV